MEVVTKKLKIGQVASLAKIGVETIRFYEREGVLPKPARKPSGYRQFTLETVEQIHRIKTLQHIGFSLPEIRENLNKPKRIRQRIRERIKELKQLERQFA